MPFALKYRKQTEVCMRIVWVTKYWRKPNLILSFRVAQTSFCAFSLRKYEIVLYILGQCSSILTEIQS